MEKFYTVEDIAKMTMFTTRTIRNYLKDGLLTGRKIGGQWRFTEDDIAKFFDQGGVGDAISSERKQEVVDFLDGVFAEYSAEIQVCTIIDVYRPIEAIRGLEDELLQLPGSYKANEPQFIRVSYEYNKANNRARFVLFGPAGFISEAMTILSLKKSL